MNKLKSLLHLRKKIISKHYIHSSTWDEVWFFPRYNGVQGYKGTGKFMFVGLNPSTGSFPSKADKWFYGILKRLKLNNAHITDAIKVRMKGGSKVKDYIKNKKAVKEQMDYLKKEIAILKPKCIFSLGKETTKILKKYLPQENIVYLTHYSYISRWNRKDKEKEFKEKIIDSYR